MPGHVLAFMPRNGSMWPDALAAIDDAIGIARKLMDALRAVNGTEESRRLVGQLLHRLAAAKLKVAQQDEAVTAVRDGDGPSR